MATPHFRDSWLFPTLEGLVEVDALVELRSLSGESSLWEAATRRGFVTDEQVVTALAERFRMRVADLTTSSAAAREAVPEALARKYRIVPLLLSEAVLDIATADPNDLDCERTLAFATGRSIRMQLAAPSAIVRRIEELYRPENAVEKLLEGMTSQLEVEALPLDNLDDRDLEVSAEKAAERPIIRLVDHVIAEGIQQRASDIHIESQEGGVQVVYRIDGVMRPGMSLPKGVAGPLVSRVKIISGLDIADRLRPQDGRARIMLAGRRVDLRVSTLPASTGEKVVIRVLDSGGGGGTLDALGLSALDAERIQHLINLREGIVLVTGPTGSGKTTTLYAALRSILSRNVNIVTVEDPVEYKLPGIVQVQVNERSGLSFAAALRSILRQDPDVVLIGEIRDRETASIATQASLTGHLVFSTLHTIDAASSVARLVDVGIENYKISAALKGVIAQRLVRRLCLKCRALASEPVPQRVRRWIPEGTPIYRPVGCAECNGLGYRGRLAIMEVMVVDDEVERRIAAGDTTDKLIQAARRGGMRSLWESGIDQVRLGLIDLEELQRVVEIPAEPSAARPVRTEPRQLSETPGSAPVVRPPRPAAQTPVAAPVVRPTPRAAARAVTNDIALDLIEDLPPVAASRPTVLLVEDEAALRMVLRDLLERDGFRVVEAGDGSEALVEIDRSAPDALVLDLNLPTVDGYEVLARLRARTATARLPILVLTAKSDEDNEVRVFELGANDFLAKPFRPRALTARLRALVRQG